MNLKLIIIIVIVIILFGMILLYNLNISGNILFDNENKIQKTNKYNKIRKSNYYNLNDDKFDKT